MGGVPGITATEGQGDNGRSECFVLGR
jgi:hypothetical protein